MPYIATQTITTALATWLRAWKTDMEDDELDPYFDIVATYDAPNLMEALNDLLSFEQRHIALVIPSTDRYQGEYVPGQPVMRHRVATFTVVLAIRDEDYIAAIEPSSTSVAEVDQVVTLKDRLLADLDTAATNVPGVELMPTAGAPQEIRDEQTPDHRLYRAWILTLETPAGSREYAGNTFVY